MKVECKRKTSYSLNPSWMAIRWLQPAYGNDSSSAHTHTHKTINKSWDSEPSPWVAHVWSMLFLPCSFNHSQVYCKRKQTKCCDEGSAHHPPYPFILIPWCFSNQNQKPLHGPLHCTSRHGQHQTVPLEHYTNEASLGLATCTCSWDNLQGFWRALLPAANTVHPCYKSASSEHPLAMRSRILYVGSISYSKFMMWYLPPSHIPPDPLLLL